LRKHGWIGEEKDLRAILRRIDMKGDSRINENEFISAIMPY
jgi:hypothetical protein